MELSDDVVASEVLYADDTLLIESNSDTAHAYMDAVAVVGSEYGPSLNWRKVKVLNVRTHAQFFDTSGGLFGVADPLMYLGSGLFGNGGVTRELNRRLGIARADFKVPSRVWKHARLSASEKVRVFVAVIESTLLYGLGTAWLSASERRRNDRFQAFCLRRILQVRPSFFS